MTAKNGTRDETSPIIIKKYANRRLYNTATSSYVTLDHLCQMVKEDVEFVVYDAKSGEDITRQVLTQIIVEEEAKGENLLPISFLRQLISFYGHGMGWMVPGYLEQMMQSFTGNQEAMAKAMQDAMGGSFPMRGIEEMSKQNMAMFERAMQMFSPFQGQGPSGSASGRNHSAGTAPSGASTPSEAPADAGAQLDSLREQVELLRQQLDKLSDEKDGKKE
ncbi:polyhydroxyalkanoate synthesis repressor PhaR [Aquibaculum arenosum]|uniref:Polyhydroxyalkanoate synthesis repressor PhaR n=1 Tax=Aquibaculum arenosum TaxID=3032591 RepID=A0ABT5YNE4_9PROT|nr:polyhydroxyalkanoate synthesis repressor PhaR [Fodinicurvata sp. CAU 1616]MDF2096470.1 polyhydroxyalkanoate synthesis repressor PhaR [Fodinicurvata sp. CAU 1616]